MIRGILSSLLNILHRCVHPKQHGTLLTEQEEHHETVCSCQPTPAGSKEENRTTKEIKEHIETERERCEREDTIPDPIIKTFARFGPEWLTDAFPIDTTPLNEILNEGGIIGPTCYDTVNGAIEALKDNYPDFITEKKYAALRLQFKEDLTKLAEQYNMPGAYSLLGGLTVGKERLNVFKKGAEKGSVDCMDDYGLFLCLNGKIEEGFKWIKKAADAGNEMALVTVGISYNYGTFSEKNYDIAFKYYLEAVQKFQNFVAYTNLASILVENGYFYSAKNIYEEARPQLVKYVNEGNCNAHRAEELLLNYEYTKQLLNYPYAERLRRFLMEQHPLTIDKVFCETDEVPSAVDTDPHNERNVWHNPDNVDIIDERDIQDKASFVPAAIPERDKTEDFVFPAVNVKIMNDSIFGTQHEIVFLEKMVHSDLDAYIYNNIQTLRKEFQQLGYIFTYLPSHEQSFDDYNDLVTSYLQDSYDTTETMKAMLKYRKERMDSDYWNFIIPEQDLPLDCVGFLRYTPKLTEFDDHSNYQYIIFPHRRGTDWPRSFSLFFQYLRTLPFITNPAKEVKEAEKKILPVGSTLHIAEDLTPSIVDRAGNTLATFNMQPLARVLYMLFLNHKEGIRIKCLVDYKEELMKFYAQIAGARADEKNIDALVDATRNSANEKISRIRLAVTNALKDNYSDDIPQFSPQGKRGEPYVVKCKITNILTENLNNKII